MSLFILYRTAASLQLSQSRTEKKDKLIYFHLLWKDQVKVRLNSLCHGQTPQHFCWIIFDTFQFYIHRVMFKKCFNLFLIWIYIHFFSNTLTTNLNSLFCILLGFFLGFIFQGSNAGTTSCTAEWFEVQCQFFHTFLALLIMLGIFSSTA